MFLIMCRGRETFRHRTDEKQSILEPAARRATKRANHDGSMKIPFRCLNNSAQQNTKCQLFSDTEELSLKEFVPFLHQSALWMLGACVRLRQRACVCARSVVHNASLFAPCIRMSLCYFLFSSPTSFNAQFHSIHIKASCSLQFEAHFSDFSHSY